MEDASAQLSSSSLVTGIPARSVPQERAPLHLAAQQLEGEWRVALKEPIRKYFSISKYFKEELCCRGALQCQQFSSRG